MFRNHDLFFLAGRQPIPTQLLHHQFLEPFDASPASDTQVVIMTVKVASIRKQRLHCCLNMKRVFRRKIRAGRLKHSYHGLIRPHFISNSPENFLLAMVAALLKLYSTVRSLQYTSIVFVSVEISYCFKKKGLFTTCATCCTWKYLLVNFFCLRDI